MKNSAMATGRSSTRAFLTQQQVFHGFNDYQNGVWGADYEHKNQYWQISYEWGRQIASWCESKNLEISWTNLTTVPRALTQSIPKYVWSDHYLR
jgi:hypothetical protein